MRYAYAEFDREIRHDVVGPRIDLTVFLSGAVVAPDRKVEAS